MIYPKLFSRNGQVMLITVLALSSTILVSTAVAGLLTVFQIRQATDVVNSSKAVFASDMGLEWNLYHFFKDDVNNPACPATCSCPGGAACDINGKCELDNKATFTASCVSVDNGLNKDITIKSIGTSNRSSRAFQMSFTIIN